MSMKIYTLAELSEMYVNDEPLGYCTNILRCIDELAMMTYSLIDIKERVITSNRWPTDEEYKEVQHIKRQINDTICVIHELLSAYWCDADVITYVNMAVSEAYSVIE